MYMTFYKITASVAFTACQFKNSYYSFIQSEFLQQWQQCDHIYCRSEQRIFRTL